MDLNARQLAFVANEMEKIENEDSVRYPSRPATAKGIREEAEHTLEALSQ